MATVYIGCDHAFTMTGLQDNTGAYLNAATVTYTIYTAAGVAVTNGTGTLSYVAASNGNYAGTIESTVTSTLTQGNDYYADVPISQSTLNDFRRYVFIAEYRSTV